MNDQSKKLSKIPIAILAPEELLPAYAIEFCVQYGYHSLVLSENGRWLAILTGQDEYISLDIALLFCSFEAQYNEIKIKKIKNETFLERWEQSKSLFLPLAVVNFLLNFFFRNTIPNYLLSLASGTLIFFIFFPDVIISWYKYKYYFLNKQEKVITLLKNIFLSGILVLGSLSIFVGLIIYLDL